MPRKFLLFLPTKVDSDVNLQNVFSYYSQTSLRLGSEGDVIVEEEAGRGTAAIMSFIKPFFAILFQIGQRPRPRPEWKPDAAFAPDSSSKTSVLEQASVAAHSATTPVLVVPEVTAAEPDVLPASDWTKWENLHMVLIACIPSTGYFAAGAIAGIVSRTATAPLDRLKVYLIAQTKSSAPVRLSDLTAFGA